MSHHQSSIILDMIWIVRLFPNFFLLFLNSKIDWSISMLKYSKYHQSRYVLVYVIYFSSLFSVNSFATDGRVIFLFHVWNFLIKWNCMLIQMRILCFYDVTLTRSITSPGGLNLPSDAQKKVQLHTLTDSICYTKSNIIFAFMHTAIE